MFIGYFHVVKTEKNLPNKALTAEKAVGYSILKEKFLFMEGFWSEKLYTRVRLGRL